MARNPSFSHSTFSAKYFEHDDLFAPAARLHPQHPCPQRSHPRFTHPRLLQVLRRKDVVPERAKLLDELDVRRKPLHVKQFVLSKPTKLRVNLWIRERLFRLAQRADITIHMQVKGGVGVSYRVIEKRCLHVTVQLFLNFST